MRWYCTALATHALRDVLLQFYNANPMATKSIFESLINTGSIGNQESNHFMLYPNAKVNMSHIY